MARLTALRTLERRRLPFVTAHPTPPNEQSGVTEVHFVRVNPVFGRVILHCETPVWPMVVVAGWSVSDLANLPETRDVSRVQPVRWDRVWRVAQVGRSERGGPSSPECGLNSADSLGPRSPEIGAFCDRSGFPGALIASWVNLWTTRCVSEV